MSSVDAPGGTPRNTFATTAADRRAIAKDMLRYVVKSRLPSRPAARPSAIPKPPAAPRPPIAPPRGAYRRNLHSVAVEPSHAQMRAHLLHTQQLLRAQQQAVAAQEKVIAAAREGADAAAAFGALAEAEVARLSLRVRELERKEPRR